jgi:hypothetical protein
MPLSTIFQLYHGITSTHGESFNMGYIQSKPVVVGDGTIVLRYRNGDLCHRGTPKQAHRSTRITFICLESGSLVCLLWY